MALHTTYVLRVPYSCGVVLVFLVLAGNSFWCYVRIVFLFLINTLLLYIPLLALTDGRTEKRIYPGWAGHPDGFLQVNPGLAGHPDGFLQVNPGWAG